MLNVIGNITQPTHPNYLENHFQGTDSKNLEKFMQIFEEYALTFSESERESILKSQIDNIEQSILENNTSQLRPTLFSSIIKKSPEFAIKYISIFRSSINLPSEGHLPLIEACKSQNVDLVKELIRNGANPNLRDCYDDIALGECIQSVESMFPSKKAEEIFDALIGAQCDMNVPVDMVNSSPLISCLTKRIDQWAWKLLPLSDMRYKNNLGMLALHQAVRYSSNDMISRLINMGSDVNALALEGIVATRRVTPCHIAVACNDSEALRLLLEAGADPHKRATNAFFRKGDEKEPYSAYLMAVDYNKTECKTVILEKCPPKSWQNELGFERSLTSTPLGRKRTLKHIAEAESLKSQSNLLTLNGVKFSIEATEEDTLKQMVKDFFITPEKDGSHLYLPIWDAICKHAISNENFTVIFSSEVTGSLCGKYNPETHNEIFIYHKTLPYTQVGESMVHEMAHKCADMIYKSSWCAPSDSNHPLFEAIETDLANLPHVNNQYAWFIVDRFTLAYSYTELQRPQECIARIPQVIFALIHKFGLSSIGAQRIMQECLPNLYGYYVNEFLPECKKLSQ